MLSSYRAVISSLHASNNDCSFTNQTDGTAWQLTDQHLIRGRAAPKTANYDDLCGYQLTSG